MKPSARPASGARKSDAHPAPGPVQAENERLNQSLSQSRTAPVGQQRRCPRCAVHPRICVCAECRPVSGAAELWVLQHPNEVGHSKGTLRVAQACLASLRVCVGTKESDFTALRQRLDPDRSALLFPARGSVALEAAEPQRPRQWILIDGTWRKARAILLGNPWLQDLPRFHFQQPPADRYPIRKSARAGSLSTVEAISYLLSLTQPGINRAPLDQGLATLVRLQLAQMPEAVRQRYD